MPFTNVYTRIFCKKGTFLAFVDTKCRYYPFPNGRKQNLTPKQVWIYSEWLWNHLIKLFSDLWNIFRIWVQNGGQRDWPRDLITSTRVNHATSNICIFKDTHTTKYRNEECFVKAGSHCSTFAYNCDMQLSLTIDDCRNILKHFFQKARTFFVLYRTVVVCCRVGNFHCTTLFVCALYAHCMQQLRKLYSANQPWKMWLGWHFTIDTIYWR